MSEKKTYTNADFGLDDEFCIPSDKTYYGTKCPLCEESHIFLEVNITHSINIDFSNMAIEENALPDYETYYSFIKDESPCWIRCPMCEVEWKRTPEGTWVKE